MSDYASYKPHEGIPPTCGCTWAEHRRLKRIDWLMGTINGSTYGKPAEREAYYHKFCRETLVGDSRPPGVILNDVRELRRELANKSPRPFLGILLGNFWFGLWRNR